MKVETRGRFIQSIMIQNLFTATSRSSSSSSSSCLLRYAKTTSTASTRHHHHHNRHQHQLFRRKRCSAAVVVADDDTNGNDTNCNENGVEKKKRKRKTFHPLSFNGAKLCANFAMISYWNLGQERFFERGARGLDFKTPFGFEFVISEEPEAMRESLLEQCEVEVEEEKVSWMDYDMIASKDDENEVGVRPLSRALVITLREPNWILVVFRGTTPSPLRGFFRESVINSSAGQVEWEQGSKVHQGYAKAYDVIKDRLEKDVIGRLERAQKRTTDKADPNPRIVITGHSLGGAMAALCAARLGLNESIKKHNTKVSLLTFGQPRVGDAKFKDLFEAKNGSMNDGYLRVVNEQDIFARVPPKSGIWIPDDVFSSDSSKEMKKFTFSYEHAGDCVWYRDDGRVLFREEPKGISLRTVNPISIALDHSRYAKLFDGDEVAKKKQFPRALCFHPERIDPKTICVNCPHEKNRNRRVDNDVV